MSKEFQSIQTLINLREAGQTTPERGPGQEIGEPALRPPAQQLLESTYALLDEVADDPSFLIEIPNPASSPSAAHFDQRVLAHAHRRKMAHRVPPHVRLVQEDLHLAAKVGALAIHGMGNPVIPGRENGRSIPRLLQTLDEIEPTLLKGGVQHFRVSLEHALDTSNENILMLTEGLSERNRRIRDEYDRPLYTALGVPDTKGNGTPEQFMRLIHMVGTSGSMEGMKVFVHLHKDNGLAIENAQAIIHMADQFGITVVIEVTPDTRFPGERVGILDPDDLQQILPVQRDRFPAAASSVMKGSSWRDGIDMYGSEAMHTVATNTNVAGIHTNDAHLYGNGNGWPAPGLYGIMGKNNIAGIQEQVLRIKPTENGTLAAAALVGRELSAQEGHLPQSYAINFSRLVAEDPGFIIGIARSFGTPDQWTDNLLPDLSELRSRMNLPLK